MQTCFEGRPGHGRILEYICFIEYDARYNVLTQPLDTFLLELQDGTAWVVMAMPTYPETVGGQPPRRLVKASDLGRQLRL